MTHVALVIVMGVRRVACRKRMEKEDLNPDNMIKPEDVCELVLLPFKVSANAVPQEIVLDAMKNPSA